MSGLSRRPRPAACLGCLLALLGLLCLATLPPETTPPPLPPSPVRLAVLVVFDQMRADYLERWQGLFGEDGFRRLQSEGAWFRNCHYPYSDTFTGPGHASLLTGCCPDRHGIIDNDWYDRDAGASISCVATTRYQPVPLAKTTPPRGASPERLLSPSVGDVLKEATGGRSRVVSLSFKDRSAVLPGGRRADACYWLGDAGAFVTSTYYRSRPHPWVERFNRQRPADRWAGGYWGRLRPELDYVACSGPDDVAGEGLGSGQGRCFPHPFPAVAGPQYYQALFNSPFGNDLLLELVEQAIDAERLGQRDVPDLLCVSFSSNDAVGHCWGPDSQEVLDVTLRSDRIVSELLAHLDARVGRGRYLLAVTADHGVCPLPEVSRAAGLDAGRVAAEKLAAGAETFLDGQFGKPDRGRWIESLSGPWFYLNGKLLRQRMLDPGRVEDALAGWVRAQPGILTAYTRGQLAGPPPAEDEIGRRVQRSFHPRRSGDVALVVKPHYILWSALSRTGTTHGTPHPYDTHVPLLLYGPGIPPGVCSEPVAPLALAAIFARALNVPPPPDAEFPLPRRLAGE